MDLFDDFVVIIDSNNRISGSSSNFSINVDLPVNSSFDRVALSQASIPRSYYDVQDGYNTFLLKEGLNITTVIITPGMYNITTLMIEVAGALHSYSPNGLTYSLSYPNSAITSNDNKITFSVNTSSINCQLIFIDSMYIQLGFNSNSTNVFVSNGVNSIIKSTNSISVSSINRIFITSSCCEYSAGNGLIGGLLQEILIAGQYPSTSFIYYDNVNFRDASKIFTNRDSNVYNFQLIDRFGRTIELNGADCVFSIVFWKKSKYEALAIENMKIKNMEKLMQ